MTRPLDPPQALFDYVERFRDLLDVDGWQQVVMDLSKNDALTMLYLSRNAEARMGDIAEYLRAPLNTATGVVARLQKRGLVERAHSTADKRVVIVSLSPEGRTLARRTVAWILQRAGRVLDALTDDQVAALLTALDRIAEVLTEDTRPTAPAPVRRIQIE